MVPVVTHIPNLRNKLHASTIPADKNLYQRQIEATDEEIDALVYELYGLTGGGDRYRGGPGPLNTLRAASWGRVGDSPLHAAPPGAAERRSDIVRLWGHTPAWCARWGGQVERCPHNH